MQQPGQNGNEQNLLVYGIIENQKTHQLRLCTGRPLPGVTNYLNELELFTGEDYVICYNGSLVQNTLTKEIIVEFGLTLDDYLEMEYLARKVGVHFHATGLESMYTANRNISSHTVREAYLVNMDLCYRTPEEMTEDMEIPEEAPVIPEDGGAAAPAAAGLGIPPQNEGGNGNNSGLGTSPDSKDDEDKDKP